MRKYKVVNCAVWDFDSFYGGLRIPEHLHLSASIPTRIQSKRRRDLQEGAADLNIKSFD